VRTAFRLAGLRYDIDRNPYVLLFDENVLRQSPGPPHSGNGITLRTISRKEGEMRQLAGSTGRCVPIGALPTKVSPARYGVPVHFCFTSRMPFPRTGG
jgi:hypothetical protein